MKRNHIKEGMVFGIPMPNGFQAVIQLIKKDKPIFYMAGFDLMVEEEETFCPATLTKANVLFLGNFFDAQIVADHWKFLGTAPVSKVPFPRTKVLISGQWILESWDGKNKEVVQQTDAERFPYRSNFGDMLLQNALLNYHGFQPVDEFMLKYLSEIDASFVSGIADESVVSAQS